MYNTPAVFYKKKCVQCPRTTTYLKPPDTATEMDGWNKTKKIDNKMF